MAANQRMKPTCQTSVLLLPGFVFAAFGFTGGVTAKHAGGLCAARWVAQKKPKHLDPVAVMDLKTFVAVVEYQYLKQGVYYARVGLIFW
jgi:hypothetical protein